MKVNLKLGQYHDNSNVSISVSIFQTTYHNQRLSCVVDMITELTNWKHSHFYSFPQEALLAVVNFHFFNPKWCVSVVSNIQSHECRIISFGVSIIFRTGIIVIFWRGNIMMYKPWNNIWRCLQWYLNNSTIKMNFLLQ